MEAPPPEQIEAGGAATSRERKHTRTTQSAQANGSKSAVGSGLANLSGLAEDLPAPTVDEANAAAVSTPPAGLASVAGTADDLPAPYYVQYDSNGFPATLLDWRRESKDDHYTARHLWTRLESWFRLNGYELFVRNPPDKVPGLRPRNLHEVRAPDQFHAIIPDGHHVDRWTANHKSNKCCPATRIRDGVHVMIGLVWKAGAGTSELEILRRFSRPDIVSHPDNHVIPLLDELSIFDMTFAVLPLLEIDLVHPWYYTLAEALDAVAQTLKGLAFMHSHFVAHLDIGFADILLNFGGLRGRYEWFMGLTEPTAFRSRLSATCRYTFIDFEVGAIFPYGSSPATHTSFGVHFIKNGRISNFDSYAKPMPPEWKRVGAFCVYKSDVYQIGKLWQKYLLPIRHLIPGLHDILDCMVFDNPAQRISMSEAVTRYQTFMQNIEEAVLTLPMWEYRRWAI